MLAAIIQICQGYSSWLVITFILMMSFLWAISFNEWLSHTCFLCPSLLLCVHQCSLCGRFKEISQDCSRGQAARPVPSPEPRPQQPVQPGPGDTTFSFSADYPETCFYCTRVMCRLICLGPPQQHDPPGRHQVSSTGVVVVWDMVRWRLQSQR